MKQAATRKHHEKLPIIILHGWGLKGAVYAGLKRILSSKGYSVFVPDLPGFGSAPLIKESMSLDDYVHYVHTYMLKHTISKAIFIGHSFGGRISLKFGWKYPTWVEKIVLTGTPVIRHISFGKKIAYIGAVTGSKILSVLPLSTRNIFRKSLYYMIGEFDYYKSGPLKQVFKKIIQEDLQKYVVEAKVPILLVWGLTDRITPVSDVEKIKKYNNNITSNILEDIGHKLPYKDPKAFTHAIMPFLQKV